MIKRKPRKKFCIEWRLKHWGRDWGWTVYSRYPTEARRDQALECQMRKKVHISWCEFRAGKP